MLLFLYYRCVQRRRVLNRRRIAYMMCLDDDEVNPTLNAILRSLRPSPRGSCQQRFSRRSRNRPAFCGLSPSELAHTVGLSNSMFNQLVERIGPAVEQPRDENRARRTCTSLVRGGSMCDSLRKCHHLNNQYQDTRGRIAMVLNYLRSGRYLSCIARELDVDRSYVRRELYHIVPILRANLNFIRPFNIVTLGPLLQSDMELVYTAIDGSAHQRRRMHPGQARYYRGDKKMHFILAQMACLLNGLICGVELFQGHNSDQGAYKMSTYVCVLLLLCSLVIEAAAFVPACKTAASHASPTKATSLTLSCSQ